MRVRFGAYSCAYRRTQRSSDAWKKLSSPEAFPEEYEVPDGYTDPLYRGHRKDEMRAAHAEFIRRLREAGWEPGDTRPPGDTEN
ncbi:MULTISPECIES: hypothetical protein [Streptomyces]|uniref:Uncharacterized protein n=1 Tax=Streptomyces caniscabiei TaxID=2746961 RepID=A0ABU4MUQ0_9ACTN|nr:MULTISPECIES: hypothetical protein [Streptomyces]MBE4740730.1 hypothetical protein [Streptomyces caniscabiei]MBE4759375.1 hypothetical protein [Streptomyces caniscabiei]MBE4769133.1 hypothetical protein [Streptomyces caniscabiei]MBE4788859.1 hypothetical protein [Streptomyces caniscabiei]MBE4798016.1 hypothetical protein [Streptomyces caniscabiei]